MCEKGAREADGGEGKGGACRPSSPHAYSNALPVGWHAGAGWPCRVMRVGS